MRIDFDRIVPKYRKPETRRLARIVTDNESVDFFLEECERYGLKWADGQLPTEFNPLDRWPDDVFFAFSLYDNRDGESGVVEITFNSDTEPRPLEIGDIPLDNLIIVDDEIGISSASPIPLDLSGLFAEVSS